MEGYISSKLHVNPILSVLPKDLQDHRLPSRKDPETTETVLGIPLPVQL